MPSGGIGHLHRTQGGFDAFTEIQCEHRRRGSHNAADAGIGALQLRVRVRGGGTRKNERSREQPLMDDPHGPSLAEMGMIGRPIVVGKMSSRYKWSCATQPTP